MAIDPRLLDILICPACQGEVRELLDGTALTCRACRRSYPIRDGIPVMLIEESAQPTD